MEYEMNIFSQFRRWYLECRSTRVKLKLATERFPSLGWITPVREHILWVALQYIAYNKLSGDYAEFGVWRGDTFATAYHLVKYLANSLSLSGFSPRLFHAFDSFEGFPELNSGDEYPQFQKGGRACSIEKFKDLIKKRRVSEHKVTITKGWFSETLQLNTASDRLIVDRSLAIAYIDCDLCESTKYVLPFLKRKMVQGGMILFDDWFCFAGHPQKGEQKACSEFLSGNPEVRLVSFGRFGWHGQGFIFHSI